MSCRSGFAANLVVFDFLHALWSLGDCVSRMFSISGVSQSNSHYAHRKKDYKRINEKIEIAQASGDEWAQELRWIN